jgi:hypothetical protein
VKPRLLRFLPLLAAICLAGCTTVFREATPPPPPPEPLAPSPRLIVGRVIAIDTERAFAFVELAADAPPSALAEGTELVVRDPASLRQTGRLTASRYVRGRTLGSTIAAGTPAVGQEVTWTAP